MQIALVLIFVLSLCLRLWIAPQLDFGVDQRAIYEIGKTFYETGVIPAEGPRLVYTGETIPGGFQAVMAGIPLFFSQGEAIGLQLWVAILNWISVMFLFFWLRKKVNHDQHSLLAAFLAFAPWTLLFTPAWNPSFLPIFAVPFFWILERVMSGQKLKVGEPVLLGLIPVLCLQLHLSAVLLAITFLIAVFFIKNRTHFILKAMLGGVLGSLFLIPWLLKKINGEASAPLGVVGLHFENAAEIPKAFFRYLTFPTSEIFRFITPQGQGIQGMFEKIYAMPWLWLPALISLTMSLVLVFVFLARFFKKTKAGFDWLEFLLPLIMPLTFLFSIKGASAHTFWIMMPLAFYSMVMALVHYVPRPRFSFFAWVYIVSSLMFTLLGFQHH